MHRDTRAPKRSGVSSSMRCANRRNSRESAGGISRSFAFPRTIRSPSISLFRNSYRSPIPSAISAERCPFRRRASTASSVFAERNSASFPPRAICHA